jgi:hypothetical protein
MQLSTIDQTIEVIKSKGGEVTVITKHNGRHFFHINCKNGHHFTKEKNHLLYRHQYCPYYPCNEKKTDWRDELGFELFKSRLKDIFGDDVICTELTPKSSKKFSFKCNKCGEIWHNDPSYQLTTPKRKKRPPSCKKCGKSNPKSILEKEDFLKSLNIIAIDGIQSLKNEQTKFRYKCNNCASEGLKTLNNLQNLLKTGLGYCDCTYKRTHWTYDKLQKAGEKKGFILLDDPTKFSHSDTYAWQCKAANHVTNFGIGSLKNGCKICYNEKRITSFDDINKWLGLNETTISLLPNQTWKGTHRNYEFHCSICNKNFLRSYYSIAKGALCPGQSRSYSELVVQFFLEKLLGIEFTCNKKYDFLINSNGKKMELDGYNEEHKIAFEHHGNQHYNENSRFHDKKNTLVKREIDDDLKVQQCETNNIKLIVIPALFEITPIEELKNVIKSELNRLQITVPKDFDLIHPKRTEMNMFHTRKKTKSRSTQTG